MCEGEEQRNYDEINCFDVENPHKKVKTQYTNMPRSYNLYNIPQLQIIMDNYK